MSCTIRYHLYNLKNVRSTHGGVLLLVKVSILQGCFSRFFNCRNGTESRKTSHITCLARPYHFKFFKGCLPQILLRHSWILCHILCSCHLTLLIFDFYCHPHTAKHWKRNFHTNIFLRNCMTSVTSFYTVCSGFWGYGQTFLFFSQTM